MESKIQKRWKMKNKTTLVNKFISEKDAIYKIPFYFTKIPREPGFLIRYEIEKVSGGFHIFISAEIVKKEVKK